MSLPLTLWDVSSVLAVTAVILLVASELVSSHYGRTSLPINKKRLRNAALVISILFLIVVTERIINIIISP